MELYSIAGVVTVEVGGDWVVTRPHDIPRKVTETPSAHASHRHLNILGSSRRSCKLLESNFCCTFSELPLGFLHTSHVVTLTRFTRTLHANSIVYENLMRKHEYVFQHHPLDGLPSQSRTLSLGRSPLHSMFSLVLCKLCCSIKPCGFFG